MISKKKYFIIKTNKKTNLLLTKFIQCNIITSIKILSKNLLKITPNTDFYLFKPKNFKILYKKSQRLKINIKNLEKIRKFKHSNFFFISTNCGILTSQEAFKKKVGGFLICKFF